MEGNKPFFFEKKQQKTFAPPRACGTPAAVTSNIQSFFCCFIVHKKAVLAVFGNAA